jgi:hypothetical protein
MTMVWIGIAYSFQPDMFHEWWTVAYDYLSPIQQGFDEYGHKLMERFSWGHAFYAINKDLFDAYSKCRDSSDVVKVQNELIAKMTQEQEGI